MDDIKAVLDQAVAALSAVSGVEAIVLGGSRARGNHSPSSDIDIGIYYDNGSLDLHALDNAARAIDDAHRENLVAPPGQWGEWVNGGAWLVVDGQSVDLVLRDMGKVETVVAEAREGVVAPHYQTGHPHAFVSAMYMGELAVSKLLWEKNHRISALKARSEAYPPALHKSLIHLFSFEAEFSLWLAERSADKDDPYYTTAHLVRSVSALNQVLFAHNRQYFLNEKKAVSLIEGFAIRPAGYKQTVDQIFGLAGMDNAKACTLLRQLVSDVSSLLTAEQTGHVAATISNLSGSKEP